MANTFEKAAEDFVDRIELSAEDAILGVTLIETGKQLDIKYSTSGIGEYFKQIRYIRTLTEQAAEEMKSELEQLLEDAH